LQSLLLLIGSGNSFDPFGRYEIIFSKGGF
jgi:hypothetical protein